VTNLTLTVAQIAIDPKNANFAALKDHDPRQGIYATGTDRVTHKPMTAYLVDGFWLRNNVWLDWVEGGNHQRYEWIDDETFWIESNDVNEADYILIHETTEFYSMRDDGLSYDAAHSKHANVAEYEARQHPEKCVEMLRALGWQV